MGTDNNHFCAITKTGEFVILSEETQLFGLVLYVGYRGIIRIKKEGLWTDPLYEDIPKEFLAWLTLLGINFKLPRK